MNKDTFKRGFTILVKSFPEKQFHADVMYEFLKDLSDEQFMKAIAEIVSNDTGVNRLTNIVACIRERACLCDNTDSGAAWGEVRRMISKVGYYGKPTFSNSNIAEVVNNMGWRNLCLSEEPMNEMVRFIRQYENIRERRNEEAKVSPMVKELTNTIIKQLEKKQENK